MRGAMNRVVDLRSDTVTGPTEEMRDAMRAAEVGDDGRRAPDGGGGDPTECQLEQCAAELLGKESALFFPSGTMANLVAVMTHCNRGDTILVGKYAHIYRSERGVFSDDLLGMSPQVFDDARGVPEAAQVAAGLDDANLLCLENTHSYSGGVPLRHEVIDALAIAAREKGVRTHLDGARLFNAAVALDESVATLAASADSVQICLSKGLSAPIGSVLAADREFIVAAQKNRRSVGGQMRQSGVIAAAGLVALRTMTQRLSIDHANARRLARSLASSIDGLIVDPVAPLTNIVNIDLSRIGVSAHVLATRLRKCGVLIKPSDETGIRIVTHREISSADVDMFCTALCDLVAATRPSAQTI